MNAVNAGWAVAAFLLGWAAKQFLDRLVLPQFLDWRARRSRKSALERAEQLLEQFELESRDASSLHHLILRVEERLSIVVMVIGGLNIGLTLLLLRREIDFPSFLIVLMIAALFLVMIFVPKYSRIRHAALFADLYKHREETIRRLQNLLAAAGLDDEATAVWLKKVPSASTDGLRS